MSSRKKSELRKSEARGQLQLTQLQPLLAHVDLEEATLRCVSRLLENVPLTVLERDAERELRKSIDGLLVQAEQLTQRRTVVLTHMGRIAGIPLDQVTFSRLIQRTAPGAVTTMIRAQSRMLRIVRQLQMLSSTVAWSVSESRSINSLVLLEALGQVTSSRYDHTGQRSLDSTSVRFEARS